MAHKRKLNPQHLPGAAARRIGYPKTKEGHSEMQFKRDIPVEVFIPEDLYINYADAFTINQTDEEFIVSFLQLQHPIAIKQEQLDKVTVAESVCIARIALTPTRLQILYKAIESNLREFEKKLAEKVVKLSQESAEQKEGKQ